MGLGKCYGFFEQVVEVDFLMAYQKINVFGIMFSANDGTVSG
jgi:hypothetical protein